MSNALDPERAVSILSAVQDENLFNILKSQVVKDFSRAGVNEMEFLVSASENPSELFTRIEEGMYVLIKEHFDQYLNLMYAVDVPEQIFKQVQAEDAVDAARQSAVILIVREWQKVCLRMGLDARLPDRKE